ncbi:MAG: hypothetical protein J6U23_00315 [Clostridiales bacterium]|nr:hypothetical protein [Clostridiales bacterium]
MSDDFSKEKKVMDEFYKKMDGVFEKEDFNLDDSKIEAEKRASQKTDSIVSDFRRPEQRSKRNQPTGYTGTGVEHYLGETHDYTYYPENWTDDKTGRSFKSGYYDEEGNYYDDLALKEYLENEKGFKCEHCGTEIKKVWKEGEDHLCPNCGSELKMFWRTKVLSGKGRKCEYCGTEIDGDFEEGETPKCPNCGSLLQKSVTVTVHDKDRDVEPVEDKVSDEEIDQAVDYTLKYVKIVVGIVLAIILIIAFIEAIID